MRTKRKKLKIGSLTSVIIAVAIAIITTGCTKEDPVIHQERVTASSLSQASGNVMKTILQIQPAGTTATLFGGKV